MFKRSKVYLELNMTALTFHHVTTAAETYTETRRKSSSNNPNPASIVSPFFETTCFVGMKEIFSFLKQMLKHSRSRKKEFTCIRRR